MNEKQMREHIKDMTQEEIRNFIVDKLKTICDEAIIEFVKIEENEKCNELLKIKKRMK